MCAGPAVSLAPLAFAEQSVGLWGAVVCLTAAIALQACCYGGFHAYVQVCVPVQAASKLLLPCLLQHTSW